MNATTVVQLATASQRGVSSTRSLVPDMSQPARLFRQNDVIAPRSGTPHAYITTRDARVATSERSFATDLDELGRDGSLHAAFRDSVDGQVQVVPLRDADAAPGSLAHAPQRYDEITVGVASADEGFLALYELRNGMLERFRPHD